MKRYVCYYSKDNEIKEFHFQSDVENVAEIAQKIMFTLAGGTSKGSILKIENISDKFCDYDSVEHFLYDYANKYGISFETVLDKKDYILKIVDADLILKMSMNKSTKMEVSLNEFIKMNDSGFKNMSETFICHNKHKLKGVIESYSPVVHSLYSKDKLVYKWERELDISIDELNELIENCINN